MKNRMLLTTAVALAAATTTFAQGDADGPRPGLAPRVATQLESWRAEHGDAWRHLLDPRTGYVEMLYGGGAAAPLSPRDDRDWLFVARWFVRETEALHGIDGGTLVDPQAPKYLPLGQQTSTDKMAVRFRQEVGGIPVEGGAVNALLALDGTLLSLQSTAVPRINAAATVPAISGESAARSAHDRFASSVGEPTAVGEPELLFVQVDRLGERVARLAWQVTVRRDVQGIVPDVLRYSIDALSGQTLRIEDRVHHFDVSGTVTTNATPGILPDTASNPETQQPLKYARVTSSAGTVFTDENGVFNYPGVNTSLNVTVEYVGQFNDVHNDAGSDHSVTVSALPNTSNSILLNSASAAAVTAQANVYQNVNAVRDWIRATDPTDSTGDMQFSSFANLASTCNAYYDGVSINFYASGGGCPNTAYSTVVAHELGHWLNDLYGTGNGSDGMGEGNADVWSEYVFDTPNLGAGFFGGTAPLRNGNNNVSFCGDCNPACYGEVHDDGQPWMGAAWKVRDRLNTTHGNAVGDAIADGIFLGWMNAYDQTQIRSIIEEQWLTLDDDDANLNNGTPNFDDIDDGFQAQGFPGFEPDFFEFTAVTDLPTTENEAGPYVVQADITGNISPPITSATLHYRVNGGGFSTVSMANVGGSTWEGSIPGLPSPSNVEYYVSAVDNGANSGTYPADAPTTALQFGVGVLTSFLVHDFEAAGNEGWTVGFAGDSASTGVWTRGNPNGTAAQPEDDHSSPGVNCWFTGQGSPGGALGANDVDGGRTTLLTPVFDLSAATAPRISYWRWYSNNTGAAPQADVFEVDVSNDGGSNWVNVETVGPGGCETIGGWIRHEFAVEDFVAATASMQLRFVAADEGSGSIVEAAIDDIEGADLTAGDGLGTRYCSPAMINSTGFPGRIQVTGSTTVSDDDLTLTATQLPPESNIGYFVMGQGMNVFTPPGAAGPLCVTPGLLRYLPPVQNTSDLGGGFTRSVGTQGPVSGNISQGSTWNFQAWHRDTLGGASNLTDAVSVTFQ